MNHAVAAANFARTILVKQERGTFRIGGYTIIFGNDAYTTDPRSQCQVRLFRAMLPHFGFADHQFGLSDDGFSWAITAYGFYGDYAFQQWFEAELRLCWGDACWISELTQEDGGNTADGSVESRCETVNLRLPPSLDDGSGELRQLMLPFMG